MRCDPGTAGVEWCASYPGCTCALARDDDVAVANLDAYDPAMSGPSHVSGELVEACARSLVAREEALEGGD